MHYPISLNDFFDERVLTPIFSEPALQELQEKLADQEKASTLLQLQLATAQNLADLLLADNRRIGEENESLHVQLDRRDTSFRAAKACLNKIRRTLDLSPGISVSSAVKVLLEEHLAQSDVLDTVLSVAEATPLTPEDSAATLCAIIAGLRQFRNATFGDIATEAEPE